MFVINCRKNQGQFLVHFQIPMKLEVSVVYDISLHIIQFLEIRVPYHHCLKLIDKYYIVQKHREVVVNLCYFYVVLNIDHSIAEFLTIHLNFQSIVRNVLVIKNNQRYMLLRLKMEHVLSRQLINHSDIMLHINYAGWIISITRLQPLR